MLHLHAFFYTIASMIVQCKMKRNVVINEGPLDFSTAGPGRQCRTLLTLD